MPTHRIVLLGLIALFILVVVVDYYRKKNLPKTVMIIDSREKEPDSYTE